MPTDYTPRPRVISDYLPKEKFLSPRKMIGIVAFLLYFGFMIYGFLAVPVLAEILGVLLLVVLGTLLVFYIIGVVVTNSWKPWEH